MKISACVSCVIVYCVCGDLAPIVRGVYVCVGVSACGSNHNKRALPLGTLIVFRTRVLVDSM